MYLTNVKKSLLLQQFYFWYKNSSELIQIHKFLKSWNVKFSTGI